MEEEEEEKGCGVRVSLNARGFLQLAWEETGTLDVSRPRASSGLHSPHGGPGSPGLSGCRGDASAEAPQGQVPSTPRPSNWAVPPPAPSLDFPLPWGQTTGQSPLDSGGLPSASSRMLSLLSPGFTTSYHMFVLSSPSPSRPPLMESSVGPSCSSPSTPPRPRCESEASPWHTSGLWQSSPMSCAGSPLASAAAPWDSPENPSYSPTVPRLLGPWAHPTQEASAPAPSPPGAGPGSSLGSPMAPGSSPPCTLPSCRWQAEASPPDTEGPWQTSPVSLAESPLNWGTEPWEPRGEPCSCQKRRLEAEASPPGPWQTSPVSSTVFHGLGRRPRGAPRLPQLLPALQPTKLLSGPRRQLRRYLADLPDLFGGVSPGLGPWQTSPVSSEEYPLDWGPDPAQPPEAAISSPPCTPWRGRRDAECSPPGAPGPWQTSPVSSAVSRELRCRHLGDPRGPLHFSEAPTGGRGQPAAWALADLLCLLGGVSSGLPRSKLGLSHGSTLVPHSSHPPARAGRFQAGKARCGTDLMA